MSLVLNSVLPAKAGRTRWPIANTIVARKPAVNAWREAPQIPCGLITEAAQILNPAATNAHP